GVRTEVGAKRGNAIGQRTQEDFVRCRVTHELNADVAVALEVARQLDSLYGTGGGGLEPLVVEDAVALDGDESGSNVGRADGDFDGVAAEISRLVELYLKFGIAIERAREVGFT